LSLLGCMHDPRARCQHCVFSAIRWQLAFLEVAWPRVNGDARAIIDLPTNISSSPHPPNNIAVTPPPQTSQRSSHRFKQTGGRTTPNKPAVAPPLQINQRPPHRSKQTSGRPTPSNTPRRFKQTRPHTTTTLSTTFATATIIYGLWWFVLVCCYVQRSLVFQSGTMFAPSLLYRVAARQLYTQAVAPPLSECSPHRSTKRSTYRW